MEIRRIYFSLCVAAGLALAVLASPASSDELTTFAENGVALGGADPVAYFTVGEPTEGLPEFTAEFDGVAWQFASAANRDAFVADPEKYAPAYGGFCTTGTSFGKKVPPDLQLWKIVDGRLHLNSSKGAHARFLDDQSAVISRADEKWPEIKSVPADQL